MPSREAPPWCQAALMLSRSVLSRYLEMAPGFLAPKRSHLSSLDDTTTATQSATAHPLYRTTRMPCTRPVSTMLAGVTAEDGFIMAGDLYNAVGASSQPAIPARSSSLPAPVDMALLPPAPPPPTRPVPALPAPPGALPMPRKPPKAYIRPARNGDIEAQLVPSHLRG